MCMGVHRSVRTGWGIRVWGDVRGAMRVTSQITRSVTGQTSTTQRGRRTLEAKVNDRRNSTANGKGPRDCRVVWNVKVRRWPYPLCPLGPHRPIPPCLVSEDRCVTTYTPEILTPETSVSRLKFRTGVVNNTTNTLGHVNELKRHESKGRGILHLLFSRMENPENSPNLSYYVRSTDHVTDHTQLRQ